MSPAASPAATGLIPSAHTCPTMFPRVAPRARRIRDLAAAANGSLGHRAEDPQADERQPRESEAGGRLKPKAPNRHTRREHTLERPRVAEGKPGVQFAQRLAHGRDGVGAAPRDNRDVPPRELPVREVGDESGIDVEPENPGVADDSHHLLLVAVRAAPKEAPADGILTVPEPRRGLLRDDGDRTRPILLGEETPARQDHPEGLEVVRADEAVVPDEGGELGRIGGRAPRRHEGLDERPPFEGLALRQAGRRHGRRVRKPRQELVVETVDATDVVAGGRQAHVDGHDRGRIEPPGPPTSPPRRTARLGSDTMVARSPPQPAATAQPALAKAGLAASPPGARAETARDSVHMDTYYHPPDLARSSATSARTRPSCGRSSRRGTTRCSPRAR